MNKMLVRTWYSFFTFQLSRNNRCHLFKLGTSPCCRSIDEIRILYNKHAIGCHEYNSVL